MNVNPVAYAHSVLASSIVRPPCSGRSKIPVPTSWHSQRRVFSPILLLALVASPAFVSAAPSGLTPGVHIGIDGVYQRDQNSNPPSNTDTSQSSDSTSISMNVWLPILIVTVIFIIFSVVTCVRRCAASDAAAAAATSTTANRSVPTPAGNTTRPRRRPRRTPSQISTKSLPAYMKEPGDQELVLFRGPSETEDEPEPPYGMPSLTEDEDEHPEMRSATFDIPLDRAESVNTMADASTTNLMRRLSAGPLELHRVATPHGHRRGGDARSLDSVGSEAGLLHGHQRVVSMDSDADPRGEAPAYSEAVSTEGGIVSLNDPGPNNVSSNAVVLPGRSRFSFLTHNPFSSPSHTSGTPSNDQSPTSIRSESPALHMRSGSALSRFSTRESHESHTRTSSRNTLARSHSRSNSNLLRAFRSHSPGLNAGSSTISLDSISAPLTHTVTRAEFYAPKGGKLLTPEQIKLITSREGLERFGVPYGADAVAFSREKLAEMGPPPEFESVTGASSSAAEVTAEADAAAAPRSTSPSRADERAESRASTDMTYETATELDSDWAQTVQRYASQDESDEPGTARPMTPRTARA